MKVFLSWSGDRSKQVAILLDEWLRCVIQAVDPWVSARGIDRGAIWITAINDQLKEATTGIVCLTKENKEKPWILFEAGALARGLDKQRVLTFLVDLAPADVRDPLGQFNHTLPTEDGIWLMLSTINNGLGDRSLHQITLEKVFKKNWPEFKERFDKILRDFPEESVSTPPSPENVLEDVRGYMRSIDQRLRAVESGSSKELARWIRDDDLRPSDENQKSRMLRTVAAKAVDSMRKNGQSIEQLFEQATSAGIPTEFIKDALCGIR
jgi:hypothetical protein